MAGKESSERMNLKRFDKASFILPVCHLAPGLHQAEEARKFENKGIHFPGCYDVNMPITTLADCHVHCTAMHRQRGQK